MKYQVQPSGRGLFVIRRGDGKFAGAFGWSLDWVDTEDLAYHYETRAEALEVRRRIVKRAQ